ncbi:MAG TPA: hypothetical protein VF251_07145 [Pyrinomonadaceae bacterium]
MLPRPVLKKSFSIAGRVLSIVTFDEWSSEAFSSLVDGWLVHPLENRNGVADATFKLTAGVEPPDIPPGLPHFDISDAGICYTDRKTFYLQFGTSVVKFDESPEVNLWIHDPEALDATMLARVLSQGFSAALRRCGLFELHSAAVVPPGETDALLIAGASGSGKSTLTAKLAAAGWSYLSDDTLLLRNSINIEAITLRQFFALTPATMAMLPAIQPTLPRDRRKERFTPQDFFSGPQIECAKPSVLLFSKVTGDSATRLAKLSPAETMSRLLKFCPWASYDSNSAGAHLSLLGRLAREATGFDMLAGTDLLHDSQFAAEFIYQAYSRSNAAA